MEPMNYAQLSAFQSMRVYHPAFRRAWDMFTRLYNESGEIDDPGCMAIYGPAGTGKSTLLRDFLAQHPPAEVTSKLGQHFTVPVVSFTTPSGCTPRDFSHVICEKVRVKPGSSTLSTELQRKALTAIKAADTKMVMPDEAQVFLRETSPIKSQKTLDFIREFYDESRIPLVLAGTEDYLSFIDSDRPLSRRIKYRAPLPPIYAPTEEKTAFHLTVQRMIANFHEATGRQLHKDVNQLLFSQRMYLASGGRIDSITNLFEEIAKNKIGSQCTEKFYTVSDFADAAEMVKLPFKLESSEPAFEINARRLPKLMQKHRYPSGALKHGK